MKHIKLWLATIAVLLCGLTASAHDFEVDGIYYNITSSTDLTVEVTFRGLRYDDYENEYSGPVVIPFIVNYNNIKYCVTSIEDYAFYGCDNLTAITLPEGITYIGYSSFENCSSLATINIPESVTNISHHAFSGCSSLTSIIIPESVTNIGSCILSGCSNISSLVVASGNSRYDSRNSCNAIIETNSNTLIQGCSVTVIPEDVKCIWTYAFRGYSTLYSIIIPEGVETIREYAFMDCSNLTNITLPKGLISIGHYAFWNCISLSAISIPEEVTSIEDCAFYNCSNLASINIPKGIKGIADRTFYGCSSLTTITLPEGLIDIGENAFSDCSNLTSINIPIGVTRIRSGAFGGCSSLTTITLPEYLTSIESGAFYGCSKLATINIPEAVASIEGNAFRGCSSLTTINIPEGITSIEGALFAGCSKLTTINIPETVTSIKTSAFSYCSSLTAINIPEAVTSIGEGAFGGCSSLTSINIPEGVSSIEHSTFQECSKLTSINIPEAVTSIKNSAFARCSSLTAINIPKGVTDIGKNVFSSCDNLKNVYCYAETVPTTDAEAFGFLGWGSLVYDATLYVPTSAINNYKSTVPWSEFGIIVGFSNEKVTRITLSQTAVTLTEGDEFILTVTISPDYATDKSVIWSTSDESVAIVNADGIVTAVAPGTAIITVVANDGSGVNASCEIMVEERRTSVVIVDPYMENDFIQNENEENVKITYIRNFANTEWQALYVPFEIPVTEELLVDFEVAYIYNTRQYDHNDDGVKDETIIEAFKTKEGVLEANYPYLIRAKEEGEKTIAITDATLYTTEENSIDCSSVFDTYTFIGTYSQLSSDELPQSEGYYALSGGVWHPVAEGTSLGAFRFYLKVDSRSGMNASQSNAIRMRIIGEGEEGDDTTSIENMKPTTNSQQPTAVYDLQGRRVENLTKGVYIVNGVKCVF